MVFAALAEDANPATAKQSFDLTNNTVSGNLANGVYLLASGGGATQVVTLTTTAPGNQIVGNGSWGVLLSATANAHQTFHANSTSLGGAGPNVIPGNTPH